MEMTDGFTTMSAPRWTHKRSPMEALQADADSGHVLRMSWLQQQKRKHYKKKYRPPSNDATRSKDISFAVHTFQHETGVKKQE